ncbi:MAG: HypC/HybG/HupF family hydrogenase formation chaperone [Chromatiales bacterium]|nr:HypC/HybG/HupF family hydrogenase formation chaperone [Chromatiales bacterium]
MCLAIPARVVQLDVTGESATVEVGGVRKVISLALLDGVVLDDYVLVHVGYAISRIEPQEAERTLRLFAEAGALVQPEGQERP